VSSGPHKFQAGMAFTKNRNLHAVCSTLPVMRDNHVLQHHVDEPDPKPTFALQDTLLASIPKSVIARWSEGFRIEPEEGMRRLDESYI